MKIFPKFMFLSIIACLAIGCHGDLMAMQGPNQPINVELNEKDTLMLDLIDVNAQITAAQQKISELQRLIQEAPWGAHSFKEHLKAQKLALENLNRKRAALEQRKKELGV